MDHEDHEHGETDQNAQPSNPTVASPESVAAATDADSGSPIVPHLHQDDDNSHHHNVTLTTAQEEKDLLVKETVSSPKKKTDEEEATREASINIIVEGFRALLWAELEKVNARYEAQERIAGVTMERLSASVSSSRFCFLPLFRSSPGHMEMGVYWRTIIG